MLPPQHSIKFISIVSEGHIPEQNKYYLPWSKNFHLPGANPNYWSAYTLILKTHKRQTGTSWRKIHMQVWRWKLLIYSSLHSWCIFYLSLRFPNILISWYMLFGYIVHVWITTLFCILVNVMKHWGEWIREKIIVNVSIWKHCTVLVITDNKGPETSCLFNHLFLHHVWTVAADLNEVIPLCYLNIYFITICFVQHN